MSNGLSGVRVMEIAGSVSLAWAAKLFADLGAEVLRLEGPADTVRNRPFQVDRWLSTSKRAARLPEPERLRELAATADIVLHDLTLAAAQAAGLDFQSLSEQAPALVVCAITPWGATGPYSEYRGEEINVIHGSSWGFMSPRGSKRPDLPPLKGPGHHATINVATLGASVALAAYTSALSTGIGEFIDFSMFAAAAKMTEFAPVKATFLNKDASRLGTKSVIPWNFYHCRDGLVQIVCPEDSQWHAFVEIMGSPDWARLDLFDKAEGRWRNPDLIDMYLSEWFATQSVAEVCAAADAAGVCLTPVRSVAELTDDEQLKSREFFAQTRDGLVLPGPPYRLDHNWWRLRNDAPSEVAEEVQDWAQPRLTATPDSLADAPVARARRPLDGVRICDFTWVWAGPFCTQQLAHMGADVIRLESVDRPDYYRRAPLHPKGVTRTLDTSGVFQMYNTDKRSMVIDLGKDGARELVLDLVRHCDVVVDNFSVGTMAQLGLAPEDLRAANPKVVVASLSGYGQTGPRAQLKAYGSAASALAGLDVANGYVPGEVMELGLTVGDPASGLAAAWAIVAALAARKLSGESSIIDVAMVEVVASTVGELWMEHLATGSNPEPRANHDAQWAPHNCYPAAGDDRWVTIACTSDEEWRSLASVVGGQLAGDERFRTAAGRLEYQDELDRILSRWTSGLDRWEVCRQLQAVGVPAFPSLSPLDLWLDNPQLDAIGMLDVIEHPLTGARILPGIPWRLTRGANGLRRPAPMLGQHTDEVLTEILGLSADTIGSLRERGVLPAV